MEYEGKRWNDLTHEDREKAIAFVPLTFDQSMAPNFRVCVVEESARSHEAVFDLGKNDNHESQI